MRKKAALALSLAILLNLFYPKSAHAESTLFLAHFDDNTRNERTGTTGTSSGISYSDAKFGKGVLFDADDYLYYGASGNISYQNGTVEFWYTPSEDWSSKNDAQVTLFMYDNNDAATGWSDEWLAIYGSGTGPVELKAEINDESSYAQLSGVASRTWEADTAYHVALTWDSNSMKLYIDGVQASEYSSPPTLSGSRDTIFVGNDMYIGNYSADGIIDEFVIFDYVRSASDILSDARRDSAFSLGETTAVSIVQAPSISEVSSSTITKTQANISWKTDKNADSLVEYGTTTAYGLSIYKEGDSVQDHLVTMTGLTAGTTYHYRVKSTDDGGNQTVSADYSFTTVDHDRVAPVFTLNQYETIYNQNSVTFSGKVTDNQTGVKSLSYTLDGQVFTSIDVNTDFSLTLNLDDGNYRLQFKAVDGESNESLSAPIRFAIDTKPPSIGAVAHNIGSKVLLPSDDGIFYTTTGLKNRLTTTSIGGATMMQVRYRSAAEQQFSSFKKDGQSAFWSADIELKKAGIYKLIIDAQDGAGNTTSKDIGEIVVLDKGYVVDEQGSRIGADVAVYVRDPVTKQFRLWNAAAFGQQNPIESAGEGYSFYLPEGEYYMEVDSKLYRKYQSEIFKVRKYSLVNTDFILKRNISVDLGIISFELPEINVEPAAISLLKYGEYNQNRVNDLIGTVFPFADFGLPSNNQRTIVSFMNTWSPHFGQQITIFDDLARLYKPRVNMYLIQETPESIEVLLARSGYEVNLYPDPEGVLANKLGVVSVPVHYVIGSDGDIQSVFYGIMRLEDIEKALEDKAL